MANDKPLSDEQRAELVAYLDGELPKPAAQAMEAKINTDPRMRAEVETLRRTWELLDYLPKPEPKAGFASRTLDRVSTIRMPTFQFPAGAWKRGAGSRWRHWTFGIGWAAAVLVAALAGYGSGRLLSSRTGLPDNTATTEIQPQLVKDFRVIENQRLYLHADDLDFLRALQDPELFGEEN
jgi:anti-sigma factor RsiW